MVDISVRVSCICLIMARKNKIVKNEESDGIPPDQGKCIPKDSN